MGKKATSITLSSEDRAFLEEQTRARTIQAQTVIRAKILLLKADGMQPIAYDNENKVFYPNSMSNDHSSSLSINS